MFVPSSPPPALFPFRTTHKSPSTTHAQKAPKLTPQPPPVSPGPAAATKHKPHAHHRDPGLAMEDYFREGELRSKEEDYTLERKTGGEVAPPPRAVGPPPRATAGSPGKDGEGGKE